MSGDLTAQLIYLSLILMVLLTAFFVRYRPRLTQFMRDSAIWGLILFGTVLAVAFKDPFLRSLGLQSSYLGVGAPVVINRRGDHFIAEIRVNGLPGTAIVDTGASDLVLSQRFAREARVIDENARIDASARTAGEIVDISYGWIAEFEFGGESYRDVQASVTLSSNEMNLIGMSFLSKFDKIEFNADQLILYP